MKAKKRVIIRTQILREVHTGYGVVEHAAQRNAIDIASMDSKADERWT